MTDIPLPDAFIGLGEAYLDAYEAIVRSNRVMAIQRYLVERWANVLSPVGFWLVVELRQQCYLNHDQDWCRVSQATLARQIHAGRRSVIRLLDEKGGDPVHCFLHREKRRRFSQRAGRSVAADSFYHVAVTDPLAPVDQAGLYQLLVGRDEELPALLKELAGLQRGELYSLLEQQAEQGPALQLHSGRAPCWIPTVGSLVREVFGPEVTRQPQVAALCSELNRAITRPDLKLLVEWYFRDRWLPRLGHARALLILALKARCYHNAGEGIDRNQIHLLWTEIAQQIGTVERQLYRLRDHVDIGRFFQVLKEGTGGMPSEVRVGTRLVPLLPEDEARYLSLATKAEAYGIHPETGQMDMLTALEECPGEAGHFGTCGKPGILAHTDKRDTLTHQAGHFGTCGKPDISAPADKLDILAYQAGHFGTCGKPDILAHPDKPDILAHAETAKPDILAHQVGHFGTQTIKALKALIGAGASSSSTSEPENDDAADVAASARLSLSPEDIAALEAGLPPEWAAALRRTNNNRKRVSVLLDMVRNLGLMASTHQADRRAWGRLMGQSGGGRTGALVLALVLWHVATEAATENATGHHQGVHGVIAEQADSPNTLRAEPRPERDEGPQDEAPVVTVQTASAEVADLPIEATAEQAGKLPDVGVIAEQADANVGSQQAIVDALAEYGVDPDEPFAQQVATLPHVTVQFVQAWGAHYRRQRQQSPASVRNLPGLLLRTLERSRRWPPDEDEETVAMDRDRSSRWQPDIG